MATRLKPVDVVIVGMGWTGGILAKELSDAGLTVLGLERGVNRTTEPDFSVPMIRDELRYAVRHELYMDVSRDTLTFRNAARETALPMRRLGSFLPGEGVGGAGLHWNGQTYRFSPSDHSLRTRVKERYGAAFAPEGMQLADWPMTYDELEPYYDKFEYMAGISGQAGNIRGETIEGGNPFEGPRSRGYPNPPLKASLSGVMYEAAARELGYHPFPRPAANMSRAYVNPDGMSLGECQYCGHCENFGCEANAKASPHITVIPAAQKNANFSLRTQAWVTRVDLHPDGKRAKGVTYTDVRTGEEFEQPADIVALCAYGLGNVHLMLLSGIGAPYDPDTETGVVGKGYCYQLTSTVQTFFEDRNFNPFMGAGSLGVVVDDVNGDNFDHGPHGFIGGASIINATTHGRPIAYRPLPPGTPKWGSEWKAASRHWYGRSTSIGTQGSNMASRGNYLSLDPTYRNAFGQPLLRLTYDFTENDFKQSAFTTKIAHDIGRAMGPTHISPLAPKSSSYSIVPYQSTHNTGGAITGHDPKTSAVNRYLQSWDVSNLFVVGASAFPQNAGYNPTGAVGALAYWTADAIRTRYLSAPGPLVPA
ncbi:GMC family oxidoreductase [Methylopila sp. Yamaguchi]|uniref:GMC family oxidoreductase n=1 Tax=Methylopila sp. Yamaguchi TaxID=1437817 RepID=UPI000CBA1218|nr:GMC family oxidoreductase [Methylopila sp. Yamaguchi]GBD48741.1 gluconate 2-dehydrogenase [Methylopila sp. Yamaguchi]